MDEVDPSKEFDMRWRPGCLDYEYAILRRELSFLKLNLDLKTTFPK